MQSKLSEAWAEAEQLFKISREVIVPSRAGDRVLSRRGHTWTLRRLRGKDRIKLPATEGVEGERA